VASQQGENRPHNLTNVRANTAVDIGANLRKYLKGRGPERRDSSWDYCFNFFNGCREAGRTHEMTNEPELTLACLHLATYLASWGMFARRSPLLRRSVVQFRPVIGVISGSSEEIWDVDAHRYSDGAWDLIEQVANDIKSAFCQATPGVQVSNTVVTKTMFGVFGCVPAFDRYFRKGAGKIRAGTFGSGAIEKLGRFYDNNHQIIETNRVKTLDFLTGQETERLWPRTKVIDVTFYIAGNGPP
jgi:hypothetical protein